MDKNTLTATQIAELAGVSISTVTRLLKGETLPNRTTLRKISRATNGATTVAELVQLAIPNVA